MNGNLSYLKLRNRSWLCAIAIFCYFLLSSQLPSAKAEDPQIERIGKIRAALIYYVVKFVEFKNPTPSPIRICLIGEDPLNKYIKETVVGKIAHGCSLETVEKNNHDTLSQINECNIVFFGSSMVNKSVSLITEAESKGMLTICATDSLNFENCLIQVFEENNKPRISVNLKNKSAKQFAISSELLDVSKVNKGGNNE